MQRPERSPVGRAVAAPVPEYLRPAADRSN